MRAEDYKRIFDIAIEQWQADGCKGCAFIDVEEWEEPCRRCRRNCKDYWRASGNERTQNDIFGSDAYVAMCDEIEIVKRGGVE